LYKKLLTEVVKRVVNGAYLLQNKNRINNDNFRKKTELEMATLKKMFRISFSNPLKLSVDNIGF
jgi:hypothetical protein